MLKQKFVAEILFQLITLVFSVLVLWPIYNEFGDRYQFYKENIAFLFVFITLTRYIFLLRYTPFSHNKLIKGALIFVSIPVFFVLLDGFYDFQRFIDEVGLQEIANNTYGEYTDSICKFTRYQFILFAAGSFITLAMFPIRMIISLWRQVNKGTV